MKYIDSEKLKAFKEMLADIIVSSQGLCTYDACKERAEQETPVLLGIITSLQQEQPDYDRALLEVKAKVDELYDEAGIGLCEYDSGFFNGIAQTCMKLRGFIKARLSSEQEQPEVDIEKEIDNWYNTMGIPVSTDALKETARHFYALGRNARKE